MSEIASKTPAPLNVRTLLFWLGVVCAIVLIGFGISERSFYLSPMPERPLHPNFDSLRSSGRTGLSFGIVGTLLIALNMAYLARRQFVNATRLGSLRSWMALHVFTGIVGSGIILFHSTFMPRSALGMLSSLSLVLVVATGLAGRYIYGRVPRSADGKELELDQVAKRLAEYRDALARSGLSADLLQPSAANPSDTAAEKGLIPAFFGIIESDRAVRREFSLLKNQIYGSAELSAQKKVLLPLAKKYCKEKQWLARYGELRFLMSSWRFFHRWFAVMMLATVAFHIIVAVQMGNLWIFNPAK